MPSLLTPTLVAATAITLASPIPNLATTRSLKLDHLIDEVELASCIDISIEGDTTDAEVKIDDTIVVENGTDDHDEQ
ncbi:hypothetical protein Ancab_004099 [Ancistrocladus abbreviatus]